MVLTDLIQDMLSEFYKQVFKFWNELYYTPTIRVQDVERQILWYNLSICVDAKPVYYKCLDGKMYINDCRYN